MGKGKAEYTQWHTRYGGKGLDTHYGEAFEPT